MLRRYELQDRFSQRVLGSVASNHSPAARDPRLPRPDSMWSIVREGATPWRRLQMQRILASTDMLTQDPQALSTIVPREYLHPVDSFVRD